jgi:N-acyl-D-amino-acid deacylase
MNLNYRVRRLALTCLSLTLTAGLAAAEDAASNDLVLRNGTIYDGSGKAPYRGDVAIKADRITYVGKHR